MTPRSKSSAQEENISPNEMENKGEGVPETKSLVRTALGPLRGQTLAGKREHFG